MQISISMGLVAKNIASNGEEAACLDLEELLATRLLVQGNSGSGKSHLLRRLLEQSAQWVQQCVIDPEGDFVTLADKFGHVVVEAARTAEELARLAARIRKHRVSSVLNLEGLEADAQMRAAAAFLNGLFEAERDYWYPLLVVVDEAQLFAPAGAAEVSEEARRQSLSAMTNLMCRGRKRGLAGIIATQRLAKLAKNVAAEASNFLMGRTFLDIDMARAADLLGMERRQAEIFRDLARGHFIALGPALSRRPLPIKIGAVETAARSGSPKLLPLPETPADAEQLIFTPVMAEPVLRPAQAPSPPALRPTEDILREVAAAGAAASEPAAEGAERPLFPELVEEEKRLVFQRLMRDIFADRRAFYQTVAVLYQDFQVRCRIERIKERLPSMPEFRCLLACARAGVGAEAEAQPLWPQACRLAENLSNEEVEARSVFLALAQAAALAAPCPGDATLARLYRTSSPRRVQSLLKHFEERGLIIVRTDFSGKRIITFPDLQIETASGRPEAEDIIETREQLEGKAKNGQMIEEAVSPSL
ncbi:ATP-binding protein [Candidatus Tokpelaia sp.]|uniref:ATP-binding protein n=1 Tax=Candidatus Tokpelaia sp. TaxID=2233777 RepID=UPI0012399B23|nr:ATP-binding protein [Candidatus Tokpelaia sp.]KAA6405721.1 ATP-binding protein [Candidatus Tokpelaia sp.]